MKSNKVFEEIRLTVVGDWIPPQLVGALALQRAEVPEVPVRLTEAQLVGEEPNLVLSTSNRIPPGQSKEAIWFDTLGVALAKRSHLLAYPEVPCSEISPQQVIHAQGIIDAKEPWHAEMRRLFLIAQETSEPAAPTFDLAMTLVAAGYGIAIAPMTRLFHYERHGLTVRPLQGKPSVVLAYLCYPLRPLSEVETQFVRRLGSAA